MATSGGCGWTGLGNDSRSAHRHSAGRAWARGRRVGPLPDHEFRDEDPDVTTTQSPATEQPKTASDAGARPYATVNPYTGETEKEFPFLPTEEIDGVIEKAHAAFQEWRRRSVEERA